MINVSIFVSGSGTNCESLIRHFSGSDKVKISVVLSNKADAYALVRAQNHGIPTVVMPKKDFNDESKLMPLMKEFGIDFIGPRRISARRTRFSYQCLRPQDNKSSPCAPAQIRWDRYVWTSRS